MARFANPHTSVNKKIRLRRLYTYAVVRIRRSLLFGLDDFVSIAGAFLCLGSFIVVRARLSPTGLRHLASIVGRIILFELGRTEGTSSVC